MTILKYFVPISLITIFGLFLLWFFKAPPPIPDNVKTTVAVWAKATENNNLKALYEIYSKKTTIKTDYMTTNGAIIKTDELTFDQLIKRKERQIINKQSIEFIDTQYKWAKNRKHIIASSTKYHINTGQTTPHILVLTSNRRKQWFIIDEYDVEYVEN